MNMILIGALVANTTSCRFLKMKLSQAWRPSYQKNMSRSISRHSKKD